VVGQYTSLVVAPGFKFCISYYDATANDLKFAFYDGSSWHIEVVDQTGDVGKWSSVAIDNSGRIHISYEDATNGDLKHARRVVLTNY
jgi:hypothetical protein